MSHDRLRLLLLTALMAAVALTVTVVTLAILYRAIFERSQVGKSMTAPDGRLLRVNTAFATMLGYPAAELQQLDFARITHPDDVAESRECVRCLLAGERDSYHLEELVEERSADLKHTVAQLEAANSELESFSYTVSHDLRAPLRAIDGFSRILVDEYGGTLADEANRYLQIVRDNTRQMGQLIDDLLAFSRLSRQELRTEPVALDEVVAEAWAGLAADRDGRQAELTIRELPTVQGDPRLLKLMFDNLLGNALKFTRPREVAQIEVGVAQADDTDVCYVRDNGVGFDMRYADKLFGVFQRLHRADQFEGTGVGLATVARVVHRHGGRVWAESVIGDWGLGIGDWGESVRERAWTPRR